MTGLDILEMNISDEFPKFKLVPKSSSWLMKAIGAVLWVVTFGKQHTFLAEYITTIGYTVYTPSDWDKKPDITKIVTLRHERVHMRQRRKYGMFLFTCLYVFLPMPGGLAYFRYKFECEAYEETMRALSELAPWGEETVRSADYREELIDFFTSAQYFWMWPFRKSLETWYDGVLSRLPKR